MDPVLLAAPGTGRTRQAALAGTLWLVASACASAAANEWTRPPVGLASFDRYLRTRLPEKELVACNSGSLHPGETREARLSGGLYLTIPITYVYSHKGLPRERAVFLGDGRGEGDAWLPGLVVAPAERWVDYRPWGGKHDSEPLILQVTTLRGYQAIGLGEDWQLVHAEECVLPVARVPARVVLFRVESPSQGSARGVAAFWHTPTGGWHSALGLGPDELAQREFLAILRSARYR